jgi:hypothetical protein
VTGLDVVGWLLGGQKSTRAGQFFLGDFFVVFLNSPHLETPETKRDKRKPRKSRFKIFVDFFAKVFRHDFFVKRFL